eukprot:14006-Heterococcus_DN1.PRE.3
MPYYATKPHSAAFLLFTRMHAAACLSQMTSEHCSSVALHAVATQDDRKDAVVCNTALKDAVVCSDIVCRLLSL